MKIERKQCVSERSWDWKSLDVMPWHRSWNADKRALPLADRHYSRQKIGSPQFCPPGRQLVLLTANADALWVTAWPFAKYVNRVFPDAWLCCMFRNESQFFASDLIRFAIAATRSHYGDPPEVGMITMIDREKVRKTRKFGYTFRKAGFEEAGETKAGLLILRLLPKDMPDAMPAKGVINDTRRVRSALRKNIE